MKIYENHASYLKYLKLGIGKNAENQYLCLISHMKLRKPQN